MVYVIACRVLGEVRGQFRLLPCTWWLFIILKVKCLHGHLSVFFKQSIKTNVLSSTSMACHVLSAALELCVQPTCCKIKSVMENIRKCKDIYEKSHQWRWIFGLNVYLHLCRNPTTSWLVFFFNLIGYKIRIFQIKNF